MEYHNPKIPEGINTSPEHPLKEFALLTAGVLGLLLVILFALGLLADRLASWIPFSAEQNIAMPSLGNEIRDRDINRYLDTLSQRLASAMALPQDMRITVHYTQDETVNAFATLGGHVVLFRGLLQKLPHENALAMVLAHEMAHVKYRHPVRSLGRGVAIGLFLSVLDTSVGNDMIGSLLGETGLLTALKFSRDQETEADQAALAVLEKLYGHTAGADTLFKILAQENSQAYQVEFFSTHPLSENRLRRIGQWQARHRTGTDVTALPAGFANWLEAGD